VFSSTACLPAAAAAVAAATGDNNADH